MADFPGAPADADERSADRDIEFGMKAIEAGHVQPLHLQSALRKLNERRTLGDRTSLPQILLELGLMTKGQVKETLGALAATVLVCTNPSCGAEFKVRAYDPGRKYKCANCKSPLRADNPEDQGELTDHGQVTITGAELQAQINEFYDIGAAAPPPPPEFTGNLHAPVDRSADWDESMAGGEDDDLGVEEDPRKEMTQRRQMSGEIAVKQIAGVPVRPDKTGKKRKDTGTVERDKMTIAGVPIDMGSSDDEDGDASFSGTHEPEVGTALSRSNDFQPAAGVPDEANNFMDGLFDDEEGDELPEPDEPAAGTERKGRARAARKQTTRRAKPKKQKPPKAAVHKVKQGPSGVFIFLVVVMLLGAAGYGGYYVYTNVLNSPGLTVNVGTAGGGKDTANDGGSDSVAERVERGQRQIRRWLSEFAGEKRGNVVKAIERVDKLAVATPELIEAYMALGELNRLKGNVANAVANWTKVLEAGRVAGVKETPFVRDHAAFRLALLKLLDERACDPVAARIAFAEVVERAGAQTQPNGDHDHDHEHDGDGDGDGDADEPRGPSPFVVAAEMLSNPDVNFALQVGEGNQAWPVVLARGLLLATGEWPGESARDTDDFDRAAELIGTALTASEAEGALLVGPRLFRGLLLGACVTNRDSQQATAEIVRATRYDALRTAAALYRARISLAANDSATARDTLDDSRCDLPGAAVVRAQIEFKRNQFSRTLELLEPVAEQLPEARLLMGSTLYQIGRYDEARVKLVNARTPLALSDLAMSELLPAIISGNRQAIAVAAAKLQQAAAMRANADPHHRDDAVLFARAGYALYRSGADGSDAAFETAKAIDPTHPELLLWRGKRNLDDGVPPKALEDLDAALAHNASDWRAHFYAGQCLLATNKVADAIKAFEKALDLTSPEAPERAQIQELLDEAQR